LGRALARWQTLTRWSPSRPSGWRFSAHRPGDRRCLVGLLRFQRPPVEPCMRFSRTRLTDALHRRCSATRARQARLGLGATTIPFRLTRPRQSGDPPLHDGVEHACEVREGLVTAPGDVPGADLPADRLAGVVADRRREVHEMLAVSALRQSGTKRVAPGSPGALLRRGPLRTERATFTALGSSKPQGRSGRCRGWSLGSRAWPA
jgi:hypothetical protein